MTPVRLLLQTNAENQVLRFTYNPADQLLTLTDGKDQVTRWNYDTEGRLTNKVDQASNEIFRYKYDPNGQMTNRWTAAKGDTFYAYDPVGNLTNVNYPGSVMDITLQYDLPREIASRRPPVDADQALTLCPGAGSNLGLISRGRLDRLTNVVDAVGQTRFTYSAAGQLLSEDGPWAEDTVSHGYTHRRRTLMSVLQPNASPWTQGYEYDGIKRLKNVVSGAGGFEYAYLRGISDRIQQLSLPNLWGMGGSYIYNQYDGLARLTETVLYPGQGGQNLHGMGSPEA